MNSDAKRLSAAKERYLTALHAVDQEVRNYSDELKTIQEQGNADWFDSLTEVLSEVALWLREARCELGKEDINTNGI